MYKESLLPKGATRVEGNLPSLYTRDPDPTFEKKPDPTLKKKLSPDPS